MSDKLSDRPDTAHAAESIADTVVRNLTDNAVKLEVKLPEDIHMLLVNIATKDNLSVEQLVAKTVLVSIYGALYGIIEEIIDNA